MSLLKLPLLHESIAWLSLTLARFCFMMKYGKSCILISCVLAEAYYPTDTTV